MPLMLNATPKAHTYLAVLLFVVTAFLLCAGPVSAKVALGLPDLKAGESWGIGFVSDCLRWENRLPCHLRVLENSDAPEDIVPPNTAATDLLSNPPQSFVDRINDIDCVDCDDLARDLFRASGNNGQILDLTVPNSTIRVPELGNVEDFVDHRVFSDGNFIFDPRFSSEPVPIDQYIDQLRSLNPDLIIKDITPN